MKRITGAIIAAAIACLAMAGCSTTNHDSGNPTYDIVLHWWRVETPPSVVTEFFACFDTTGLWLDQADGNISTTPNDPMCPKNGQPYRLVKRSGTDPAVDVGGFRIVPPDKTGLYQTVNGRV